MLPDQNPLNRAITAWSVSMFRMNALLSTRWVSVDAFPLSGAFFYFFVGIGTEWDRKV